MCLLSLLFTCICVPECTYVDHKGSPAEEVFRKHLGPSDQT